MVLRKLQNGELIQIDLHHDEEGKRYATVYGVEWKIPYDTFEDYEDEIFAELALLNVDEGEILTDKHPIKYRVV